MMEAIGWVLCALGDHSWMVDGDKTMARVRRCRRCDRCEYRTFLGPWARARHLENDGR